jgi:hypothetical protein
MHHLSAFGIDPDGRTALALLPDSFSLSKPALTRPGAVRFEETDVGPCIRRWRLLAAAFNRKYFVSFCRP